MQDAGLLLSFCDYSLQQIDGKFKEQEQTSKLIPDLKVSLSNNRRSKPMLYACPVACSYGPLGCRLYEQNNAYVRCLSFPFMMHIDLKCVHAAVPLHLHAQQPRDNACPAILEQQYLLSYQAVHKRDQQVCIRSL